MHHLPDKPKEAIIRRFNELHRSFMEMSKTGESMMVKQVNAASQMGILLKELLGVESVTRARVADWLATNPGRLVETHVDWLMNYFAISRKVETVKQFAEVPRAVAQMTFQCAGILPEQTGREVEQISRTLAPPTAVWKIRSDLEKHLARALQDAGEWDGRTRDSVRAEIKKAIVFLEKSEASL